MGASEGGMSAERVRQEIQIHYNGRHEKTIFADSFVIATAERDQPNVFPISAGGLALIGVAELAAGLLTICAQAGKLGQVMELFERALDTLHEEHGTGAIDPTGLDDLNDENNEDNQDNGGGDAHI